MAAAARRSWCGRGRPSVGIDHAEPTSAGGGSSPAGPLSGPLHILGALLAVAGTVVLWRASAGDAARQLSFLIYGLSMITLFAASAAYHSLKVSPVARARLRRIDHATAFLLIAGTYTPILYNALGGAWRWSNLAIIWLLAAVGIVVETRATRIGPLLRASIYVAVGWFALVPFYPLSRVLPFEALAVTVAGGVAYTVGAVIYGRRWPDPWPERFGAHEIWHLFVLLGSALFFALMASWIVDVPRV